MRRSLLLLTLLSLLSLARAQAIDYPTLGKVERLDPALDALIPADAKIEKLCDGFTWAEGPVWHEEALLFSDVPQNIVYAWRPGSDNAEIYLRPSGMLTPQDGFREQGSNGLSVNAAGELILCEHGERRVARLDHARQQSAIVDHFEGKRFNSPNDLAIRGNGDIYFTDPPYGLEKLDKSPLKELPYSGVYRVTPEGQVTLLTKEIAFPNGIAFSPDEKTLYIGVTDPGAPRLMAYDVQEDGTISNGRLFFDARPLAATGKEGSCDGLKVDAAGNLYSSAPGGLAIISPAGKLLGTLSTGTLIANCAWGDDGSTLYLASNHMLCRIRTTTRAARMTK